MSDLRKPCRVRGCRQWHHKDFPMCSIHIASVPPHKRAEYWMDPSQELADELVKLVSGAEPEKRRNPSDESTRRTHLQQRAEIIQRHQDEIDQEVEHVVTAYSRECGHCGRALTSPSPGRIGCLSCGWSQDVPPG